MWLRRSRLLASQPCTSSWEPQVLSSAQVNESLFVQNIFRWQPHQDPWPWRTVCPQSSRSCRHEDRTYRGLHSHPQWRYKEEGWKAWTQAVGCQPPTCQCGDLEHLWTWINAFMPLAMEFCFIKTYTSHDVNVRNWSQMVGLVTNGWKVGDL